MVCNIERPSPADLFLKYRQMFQNTVLGGAAIIPESNEWYATSLNYAMAEEFYAIAEQAWKERDPATACAENLYAMAARDGMYPRPAQPAQGYVMLSGTPGAALPANMTFTIDGEDFVQVPGTTPPQQIGTSGTATVRIRAVTAGDLGGLDVDTGTLNNPPANVSATVQVRGCAFCWGRAAEPTETFRQRYLNRLQYQPRADALWLVDKFMDWPCVSRAMRQEGSCCVGNCSGNAEDGGKCGCVDCGGTNNYYVFMDNSFDDGIIPENVRLEIEEWMFGKPQGYGLGQVPIGICGTVRRVTPAKLNVIVDVSGCLDSGDYAGVVDIVREYWTTVEPSKAITTVSLQSTIDRAYPEIESSVTLVLDNPADGYGAGIGPSNPPTTKVYVSGGCSFEPDCDVLLTLGDITITPKVPESEGCA